MVVSLLKCQSFIQIIIVGHLCTDICFEIGQIMGLLALRAYRRRAQDSEVMVVSLFNCQSSTIVLLNFHFPEFSTFFIVLRDLWQRQDQVNKFILLYAWCDNHRG